MVDRRGIRFGNSLKMPLPRTSKGKEDQLNTEIGCCITLQNLICLDELNGGSPSDSRDLGELKKLTSASDDL